VAAIATYGGVSAGLGNEVLGVSAFHACGLLWAERRETQGDPARSYPDGSTDLAIDDDGAAVDDDGGDRHCQLEVFGTFGCPSAQRANLSRCAPILSGGRG